MKQKITLLVILIFIGTFLVKEMNRKEIQIIPNKDQGNSFLPCSATKSTDCLSEAEDQVIDTALSACMDNLPIERCQEKLDPLLKEWKGYLKRKTQCQDKKNCGSDRHWDCEYQVCLSSYERMYMFNIDKKCDEECASRIKAVFSNYCPYFYENPNCILLEEHKCQSPLDTYFPRYKYCASKEETENVIKAWSGCESKQECLDKLETSIKKYLEEKDH